MSEVKLLAGPNWSHGEFMGLHSSDLCPLFKGVGSKFQLLPPEEGGNLKNLKKEDKSMVQG